MSRLALAVVTHSVLLLVGCDVEIQPLRPDGGSVSVSDAGLGALTCADEAMVRARVFEVHCADSDCHDADRPRAGLDLVSPGIRSRVVGRRSVHDACGSREIVVPGLAPASFLLDKVLGTEGECGDPMPLDANLTLEERRCLVEWIESM